MNGKHQKSKAYMLVGMACALPALTMQAQSKPNVVWIVSEDNTPMLGCYGDDYATSPNIDALAENGVLYNNAYCTAPVSAPSRSTIITGLYASSMGTQHMRSFYQLSDKVQFFTNYMREAGYYCGNFGKGDYNVRQQSAHSEAAWDLFSKKNWAAKKGINLEYIWTNRPEDKPFFCVFNIGTSHESSIFDLPAKTKHDPSKVSIPAYVPKHETIARERAYYYDKIEIMDGLVGKVLESLKAHNLSENTIVFYYGDNGGVLSRSKRFMYEAGLHVPMVLYFPKKYQHLAPAARGSKLDRMVSFVDLAPSMLNMLGLDIPKEMQGLPFLGKNSDKERQFVYAYRDRTDERYDMSRAIVEKRFKYIRNYMPHRIWGQHLNFLMNSAGMQEWKRQFDAGTLTPEQSRFWGYKSAEELYDLKNDPDEVHNLAADKKYAKELQRMRATFKDFTLKEYDCGLMPERMIELRAKGQGLYDFIRSAEVPFAQLYDMADIATRTPAANFHKIAKGLTDKEPAIRYWAAVGCAIAAKQAKNQRLVLEKLMLEDQYIDTRIAAAEALFKLGAQKEAVAGMSQIAKDHKEAVLKIRLYNTIDALGHTEALDNLRREIIASYETLDKKKYKNINKYAVSIVNYWNDTL